MRSFRLSGLMQGRELPAAYATVNSCLLYLTVEVLPCVRRKGAARVRGTRNFFAVIYFDHNASSPLLPEARTAWLEAEETFFGNPSSPHRLGARAEKALEEARGRLAKVLGCVEHEVVWTSGATEACNMVMRSVA